MTSKGRTSSVETFLCLCIGYCLTWEIAGRRAPDNWDSLRSVAEEADSLSELQRWMVELYEEGPPSAQEERSLVSRMEASLQCRRDVDRIQEAIVSLLPESMHAVAERHSLMEGFSAPAGGRLRSWLITFGLGVGGERDKLENIEVGEREREFIRLLDLPAFEESFRRYWHTGVKNRNNRDTRVLIYLGLVMGQIIKLDTDPDFERWGRRLSRDCLYSEHTQREVLDLARSTMGNKYDAAELAYRMLVDAKDADRANLKRFIDNHRTDLSNYADDVMAAL